MMTFLLIVMAIVTANVITATLAMLVFSSEKVRTWLTKQCFKMFDDMEKIEELQ